MFDWDRKKLTRTSCNFDPAFPKCGHLPYDEKKQLLVKGVWQYIESLPGSELRNGTMIDCADRAGSTAGQSPAYFSDALFAAPATSAFGAPHIGDWW